MIPPRRILAGVDFSAPSRNALDVAARLAKQSDAELHVLHAEHPLLSAAARAHNVDLARETRDEIRAFVLPAVQKTGVIPHYHAIEGASTDVICTFAAREAIDVIVVGAHGMSGVERLLFGSTTAGVLRRADVPVLVIPAAWTIPHPESNDLQGVGPIVTAVDFSEASLAAAEAACRLAALLRTAVDVIHVVPDLPVITRWQVYAHAAIREQMDFARRRLAAAVARMPVMGPVHEHVVSGPVPERLTEATNAIGGRHPLLVMGRRLESEKGWAPGATAYRILAMSRVPVLVHPGESTPHV